MFFRGAWILDIFVLETLHTCFILKTVTSINMWFLHFFLSVVMATSNYHPRVWIITCLNFWKIIFQMMYSSLLYCKCISHSNAINFLLLHSFQRRSDPIGHNCNHATLWRHCSQTWLWMFLKFCTYMQNVLTWSNTKFQVAILKRSGIIVKHVKGGKKILPPPPGGLRLKQMHNIYRINFVF